MTAKEKLQDILHGNDNFYFRFKRIGIYKKGLFIGNLTDENSPGAGSVFKKDIMNGGGIFAKIDIDEEETWNIIQRTGAFRGMYSGFDLLLDSYGWNLNEQTLSTYSITYWVAAGGIDTLTLIAEGEKIRLQINSGDYILLLTDVLNFY